MKTVCIYHNADPDGIFSGAIVLKRYPQSVMIGYNYEEDVTDIIEQCHDAEVFMVDVSFRNWVDMHALCAVAKHVTWIDHHKSALEDCRSFRTETIYNNFTVVFEEEYGACYKAWQYLFADNIIPYSVQLSAMYDVWFDYGTFNWHDSILPFRYACNKWATPEDVLLTFDWFMNVTEENQKTTDLIKRGKIILQYVEKQNETIVNSSLCFESIFKHNGSEYKVLVLNQGLQGDMFASRDVSNYDFLVGFVRKEGEWKVSMRGAGKNIDLGSIAKAYNGGGHVNAAGFAVKTFEELRGLILNLN